MSPVLSLGLMHQTVSRLVDILDNSPMRRIEPVPDEASPLAEQARALFRQYRDFLRDRLACGTFDFAKFDGEIAALPAPYTALNGEVLVAFIDQVPAAVIAYRATEVQNTCDIKRLYVHPNFRSRGLSRDLVSDVLARATARNFTRAILDTDTINMPEAHTLYLALGFKEYKRHDNLTYLELPLV